MSLYDYLKSREILETDSTFAALIMAASKKARTITGNKLEDAFPRIVGEFRKRQKANWLGILDGDEINVKIGNEKFKKIFKHKED